jgi:oxaloacetate decarboxylase alpha subunit
MGCHSIAIKDMAGLLTPYVAYELVKRLKATVNIPIALHCHATTGLSTTTLIKAAEAGIDMVDTAISSMSMTYGHSSTEAVVSILEGTERDTGLNMKALEEIAAYFRDVRKKYAKFEGSLRGTDSRILVAQVPGGMLTNMESQLKEQGAADRLDEVLEEIPRVRKDLGYLPLVTPTSQIVGTQAVLNVLTGERYKSITKETSGVLKGEYGATPAPVDKELQQRVLEDGQEPITCRPADLLENELQSLTDEFETVAKEKSLRVADEQIDDVLTYALFPQIGMKFLENRDNPSAFEPVPTGEPEVAAPASSGSTEAYTVVVDGHAYNVSVGPGGKVADIQSAPAAVTTAVPAPAAGGAGQAVPAPLAGNIFKINTAAGQMVKSGDVIMVLEAMKMETEVRAPSDGVVQTINVKEGDVVQVGDTLITLG